MRVAGRGMRAVVTRREELELSPVPTSAPPPGLLADAYDRCRRLNQAHGRSYFLATRLLPAPKRRHVHALYAFARWADEIVDTGDATANEREARLKEWGEAVHGGGDTGDPLLPAVLDTIGRYRLDIAELDRFLTSMAMDITVTGYPTYAELLEYMSGSAAAIGALMLPILGTVPGADQAIAGDSARQLGYAFQLTNFIRDVGEDLRRGRVYLPDEDLDRFRVTRRGLAEDAAAGRASTPVRSLIRFECGRALVHYRAALPGLALLEPRSRLCLRAAYLLYGGILRQVRRQGYDVLRTRARVPRRTRATIIAAAGSQRVFERLVRHWPGLVIGA